MWSRLLLVLVTLFFITMNVLLWRLEIAGHDELSSPVSAAFVWKTMLQASDVSTLEIRHAGAKVGSLRWLPSLLEEPASGAAGGALQPEGMIKRLTGYNLELDGQVFLAAQQRLRFNTLLRLDPAYAWQELSLRLNLRPHVWEVSSVAAEQTVRLRTEDESGHRDTVFTFADLQQPERLLRLVGAPEWSGLLLGLPVQTNQLAALTLGLKWQARQDYYQLGHARLRGYRLQARLFDRYQISVFVDTAGGILRAELPGDLVLLNEGLTAY
jgi:hypothetical protein